MAAVTRSCPNLVDQLCHTPPPGLAPHPVSQSSREPNQQQQQTNKQQQQHVTQQQQQLGEQQQQQQVHAARCSPDVENPTALGGVSSHSTAQLAQEEQQPNKQQQPDQELGQMQAKQQAKQQGPPQQQQQQQEKHPGPQQQQQQQQQGTGDQDAQQHSDSQQQHGQQHHPQPQDGSTAAHRLHDGHQVTRATMQHQHHTADESAEKSRKKVLTKLRVKAVDWRAALAAAPLPCSARQSLSALSSGHARALPHHLVPLLLPCITRALQCVAAAQLPWQDATAAALEACTAAASTAEADAVGRGRLERLLAELGAVEGPASAETGESRHTFTASADGVLGGNTARVDGSKLARDHML